MRRRTGIILVGAAACLLPACGPGSAPPPDSRPPASSAAPTSTPPAPSTSSPAAAPARSASTDTTPAPTAPDPNIAPPAPASAPTAALGGTPGQPGTASTPAAGGSSADSLDDTSSRWFDTFCSAMSTAATTRDALDSVNAGDAASEQSTLLGLLITMGDTFTSAAATLAGMGTPPVTAGDTWPATVQSTLTTTAQQLTAAALAAADPNDTAAQAAATDTLITRTDQARQLVQSIADIDLSDAQRAALGELPSCRGVIG